MSDDRMEAPAADAVMTERKPRPAPRRRAAKPAAVESLVTQAEAVIDHAPAAPLLPPPTGFIPPAAVSADSQEDPVMDTVDTAAQNTADFANDAAERTAAAGQAATADFTGRAQDAMARGAKMFEEFNDFGKGNVEAIVESGRIAAKGAESLGQQAAEYARKSFEDATAAARTLAATRSPAEFMRLQGDYVRQMFDAMVAESGKSTEAMIKLANDVAQPLSNRFALAAEKVRTAA